MKREKTPYPGVFFRLQKRLNSVEKEKVFYIIYRQGGRGAKLIEEPVGRETEGMTPAKAAHIRADRARCKDLPNVEKRKAAAEAKQAEQNKPTFARLWKEYCQREAKAKYIKDETFIFNNHLRSSFENKTPAELLTLDIDRLRVNLKNQGKAPATIKHVMGLLKRIINYSVRRGLCDAPARLHFTMPKLDNKKTECMTSDQLAAYLAALDAEPDQYLAAFLRLALFTGMRRGALLALQWSDLDFEYGFITLRGESAKKGKTERIPMPAIVKEVLSGLAPQGDSPFLFPGVGGGKREDFRRMSRRVRDAAGLPKDFRPLHGLRHTFASLLASSGEVDLYTLQKLLTHESPDMTIAMLT